MFQTNACVTLTRRKTLPECTIGRTGNHLLTSRKELTVIMVPCERFSSFPQAVDGLYRSVDVPFNLIVVEGHSPAHIRSALEKRQRQHKNITIIYSDHAVSMSAAINLATVHLKTKYAFLMDSDLEIPCGSIGRLLNTAKQGSHDIVWPQLDEVHLPKSMPVTTRICFLVSQAALQKLGKFDEHTSPFTAGIDIRIAATRLGLAISDEATMCLHCASEHLIWPIDKPLYSYQWDEERIYRSFQYLEKKWGIELHAEDYAFWIKNKNRELDSTSMNLYGAWAASKWRLLRDELRARLAFRLPKTA